MNTFFHKLKTSSGASCPYCIYDFPTVHKQHKLIIITNMWSSCSWSTTTTVSMHHCYLWSSSVVLFLIKNLIIDLAEMAHPYWSYNNILHLIWIINHDLPLFGRFLSLFFTCINYCILYSMPLEVPHDPRGFNPWITQTISNSQISVWGRRGSPWGWWGQHWSYSVLLVPRTDQWVPPVWQICSYQGSALSPRGENG